MRFSQSVASAFLASLLSSAPVFAKDPEVLKPCTIRSSTTHSFYDLSSLAVHKSDDGKKAKKDDREESWHARGYDYGANFTLNICAPVVEDLDRVKGLSAKEIRNVSAYYTIDKTTYSLGQTNTNLTFRGRKLVLNYTGGSPCSAQEVERDSTALLPSYNITKELGTRKNKHEDEDDDEDEDDKPKHSKDTRRKSAIISFLCDSSPNAPKAAISFVGSDPDHCSYFFEARSPAACGGASVSQESGSVGPAGVFGLIALIAVAAYILGGVAYQRTVMHQRGWKQLPNYGTWAGIGNFIKVRFSEQGPAISG